MSAPQESLPATELEDDSPDELEEVLRPIIFPTVLAIGELVEKHLPKKIVFFDRS